MNNAIAPSYDVVVVGGGPSGAIAARLLALENVKVAVFERNERFSIRVGESLMPRAYDMVQELGLGARMAEVSHVAKLGASFGFGDDKALKRIAFTDGLSKGGANAYNVDRASFDEMLLDAARDAGAEVHRGCSVQSIEKLEDDAVEVMVGGQRVRASMLVDASGANTLVARHLGHRKSIPEFRNFAYYAHYTGVKRGEGLSAGDVVVIMCDEGWFWLIPIDETRTSVGFVVDVAFAKNPEFLRSTFSNGRWRGLRRSGAAVKTPSGRARSAPGPTSATLASPTRVRDISFAATPRFLSTRYFRRASASA